MRGYFNTIDDMLYLVYGEGGALASDFIEVRKADAPVLTSTTGVFNAVFGAEAWRQLNDEANLFGVLPKYVWDKTGERLITADGGSTADGGIGETDAIPDTIKPTWTTIEPKPKEVSHAFSNSAKQEFLATKTADDAVGSVEDLRIDTQIKHKKAINQQMCVDVDTLASNSFESIDRVCSAYAEIAEASLDAGDADIYGLDRDAGASFADAYYDGNSGTDRDLTDAIINDLIDNTGEAGANTTIYVTGHDGAAAVRELYQTQVRYNPIGQTKARVGVNGIETDDGFEVGMRISTLYGVPIIVSQAVQKDTLSRFYAIDASVDKRTGKPRCGIKTASPTLYFETGMNKGDPFAVNKFGNEGAYYTSGELACNFLGVQGKIRDLK